MNFIQIYIQELWLLTIEMAPWLLLGLIFAGILKVYFPQDKVHKYLGKSDSKSALNASLLGIPMPLCSCGVIPTGISFYKNGASKGATNSFLISTPQTGIDSILATYSMLGWPFAVLRPFIAFVTGVLGGIVTNIFIKDKPKTKSLFSELKIDTGTLDNNNKTCEDDSCSCHIPEKKNPGSLYRAANYAFVELLQDIARWLIIGFLVAALISVLLPDDFFSSFKGYGFLEILIVLAASVPIYVCATGSIPIAAVLLMKGVSPGAALVFLMAGPATNVATMTVLGKTLGRKSLILYMLVIIGGAVLFGLLINWLVPGEWLLSKVTHIQGDGEGHEMLPNWLQYGSAIALIVLMIAGYFIDRYQKSKSMILENSQKVKVEGMTCSHCEATVQNNLKKIDGINDVVADNKTGTVMITGTKINLRKVEEIVNGLGYKYIKEI